MGIGAYLLKRIQNPQSNDEKISTLTNKQTLIHLIDELDRRTQDISKLITEPHKLSNEVKQHQTISNDFKQMSNSQTIETTGTNETIGTTETSSPRFDLLWNYPVLLWFLSELYEQNIFNFKVEKIINRLIEPLSNENNLLKLHSNRLLLALALTKLHQTIETTESSNCQTISNPQTKETTGTKETKGTTLTDSTNIKQIQTLSNKLLASTCDETILSELPVDNTTFRFGSAGIAWVYRQLYKYSEQEPCMQKSRHWIEKTNNDEIFNINQNSNNIENELRAFGLLEGFAGIGLLSRLSNNNH